MAINIKKSALTRGLTNNYKLVPYLDKVIGEGEFEWDFSFKGKQGDDAFHPSSHCIPEPWELYQMIFDDKPEIISAGLRKTFMVGHFWHAYIQYVLVERLGFCGWEEIEAKGTRVWGMDGDGKPKPFQYSSGAADIASCEIPIHGDYLIDIKTCNTYDFRSPGLPARFKDKYTAQANIYMDFFDKEKCIILKIAKDSPHDFAEVELTRNQDLIDAIYDKWAVTGACIAEKFEPDPSLVIELPFNYE